MRRGLLTSLAALIAAALGIDASAQPTPRWPREVRVIVGSGVGGGYDAYARLAAPFIGKYLPGRPSVVVQNMPGGGGLRLANYMASIAPRDGSEIAITNRNMIATKLLGLSEADNVRFDPTQLTWVGNLTTDVSFVIIRAAAKVHSIEDLRQREITVGSTTPADNNGIFPWVCNNLLGTRFRVITGYSSSADMALAMDRGEIDGVVGFSWSSLTVQRPDWLANHGVDLVMQLGLTPLPQAPDVPLILDFAKNPLDRAALELLATLNTLGRPFFAPPGVADPVVGAWREAFASLVHDEGFLAQAQREKLDVSFTDGATLGATVARLNGVSAEVATTARRAMAPGAAVDRAAK